MMRKWSLEDKNVHKYIEDDCMPKPAEDEVLIRVMACGICGSDIIRVYETGAHRMPLTIGHEFSGSVVKVGSSVDRSYLNKRVGVFPLIPCRKCLACRQKKYEMCSDYSYLGSRCDGGFADYVCVPKWNIIELSDNVTYEQAAMLEPMSVAVHAIRQLAVNSQASVAVCGLGTIGQLIVMFLLQEGVKNVYAIGNKTIQKDALQKIGLSKEHYCDSRTEDVEEWIKEKTKEMGIDAYFECVGRNDTVSLGIEIVAPNGQICLVGNPCTDMSLPKNLYWKILRKQLTLKGTWNSSFYGMADDEALSDDWNYVLGHLVEGKIKPEALITHRFGLAEIDVGFEIMKEKKEEYIKIMMINSNFQGDMR